ncbi:MULTISPECIES: hypothetical protein [unclassified Streptomyces]|uniref:hypothetical protein n=1 Tax=unclassified Streptomyces TaxID=2593676 RepID=UPI00088EF653|nr:MULTISPECIES: hypothetical protein [unclassified Streptomyces]PBC86434.1 hypothetical protein BX261_6520 [Streptomyces sp. 2321.6]SDQ84519.1 hypothetical protein SAMN05216511_0730 [Streptomyces sp. KS_16]SED98384.1 hypothetical protein SAMN05428940_6548 [Streptomyces sp. 2133.1]SNC73359.1 hypothetical protein SAMN06272741_6450 [Streptomyces sp. 2114.4]
MRHLRRRVPVLAGLFAAALLAGAGVAQAATGTIELDLGTNITNPVDGKCYNTENASNVGQREVVNHTNRKLKVFIVADCTAGKEAKVLAPGQSYRASDTWFPVVSVRRVQTV